MDETKKILIIDDEKTIVDILTIKLQREGYKIIEAYDGEYGYQLAMKEKPDLILLDLMLPKMDGLTVCKKIRETSNVPIIMLTAKEENEDKVLGLGLGADDYITKPYNTSELIARVKANLRKVDAINSDIQKRNMEMSQTEKNKTFYDFGVISIDFEKYEVKLNDELVDLTLKEFELLKYLITNRGKIISREKLLEDVWGYKYYGNVRTVDVTLRRIRAKIEKDSSNPEIIITKRGLGYAFNNELELKQ